MLNIFTPRITKINIASVPFSREEWRPQQVNHIYGENGTGKTTLAGLLSSDEGVVWEDGFSSSDVRILCYNRQYVERFFRMEDRIPGIFSTQGIDREAHEQIRVLKGKLEKNARGLTSCEDDLRELDGMQGASFEVLKKACWKGTAGFRKEYGAALRGGLTNSEKFTNRLLETMQAGRESDGGSAGSAAGIAMVVGGAGSAMVVGGAGIAEVVGSAGTVGSAEAVGSAGTAGIAEAVGSAGTAESAETAGGAGTVGAEEELRRIYTSAFMKEAPTYSHLAFPSAADAYKSLPGKEFLSRPVMSSTEDAYSSFVHSLHAADWVHTGREAYLEKADGSCPFCGQPLPMSFEESLHRLFDDAFEAQMSALRSYEYAFKAEMNRIYPVFSSWLRHPFPEIAAEGRLAALLGELKVRITEAVNRIHEKILRPGLAVDPPDFDELFGKLRLFSEEFNRRIDQHNRIIGEQKSEQEHCRRMAWQILTQQFAPSLRSFMGIVRKNDAKRAQIRQRQEKLILEKQTLEEMLRQQESRTQNSREAVDAVNRILAAARYQGFSLRERPGTEGIYEIVRADGTLANTLSDGEYNMLTFLYFFQQAIRKGGWDESPQGTVLPRILILDDPTNGLDRRGRKIVASLISQLSDQCLNGAAASPDGPVIAQIFQFTHDLEYFRTCMDIRKDVDGEAWVQLRKQDGVTRLEVKGD